MLSDDDIDGVGRLPCEVEIGEAAVPVMLVQIAERFGFEFEVMKKFGPRAIAEAAVFSVVLLVAARVAVEHPELAMIPAGDRKLLDERVVFVFVEGGETPDALAPVSFFGRRRRGFLAAGDDRGWSRHSASGGEYGGANYRTGDPWVLLHALGVVGWICGDSAAMRKCRTGLLVVRNDSPD